MTEDNGMEMVEKVARALCADTMSRWRDPLALQHEPWKAFIPAARAAILAMREPIDEMISKGTDAIYSNVYSDMGGDVAVNNYAASECFKAMIDAALAGQVSSG